MPRPANDDPEGLHDRQVTAIMNATAKLWVRFGPEGFTPEAIFEGAVKGAAVQMMAARSVSPGEVAELLDAMAEAIRDVSAHSLTQH